MYFLFPFSAFYAHVILLIFVLHLVILFFWEDNLQFKSIDQVYEYFRVEKMQIEDVRDSYKGVLQNRGPFMDEEYEYDAAVNELENAKILIIGAGGLGCEILKDLAFSGIRNLSIIDMDTIELTNLNRQFLFKEEHIGKSKAIIASETVKSKFCNINIQPYFCKIQDFDDNFYKDFTIIVCGLDSIEARRWINMKIIQIAKIYNKVIPIIDGGTEGLQGSVKIIIPTFTACFECYMPLIPEKITYPLCTLASTPRLPEHCIEWAHQLEWEKVMKNIKFDPDNDDHVNKMYEISNKRAKEFGIGRITKNKVLGVIKNIIPAIASTNAIISGICCNECIKFLTGCNPNMKDSLFYNGEEGILCETDEYHQLEKCKICGEKSRIEEIVTNEGNSGRIFSLIKGNFPFLQNPIFLIGEREIDFSSQSNLNFWSEYTPNGENAVIVHVIDKSVEQLSIKIVKMG